MRYKEADSMYIGAWDWSFLLYNRSNNMIINCVINGLLCVNGIGK